MNVKKCGGRSHIENQILVVHETVVVVELVIHGLSRYLLESILNSLPSVWVEVRAGGRLR